MMIQKMLERVKNQEKGFTLVELLIVVAIIAILAAIAIPQFGAYRRRGYAATVNADLKNAYTAAQAYLVDNPAGTVNSAALTTGGYNASPNVTIVTANMTQGGGKVNLKYVGAVGLTKNTAEVAYTGTMSKATP